MTDSKNSKHVSRVMLFSSPMSDNMEQHIALINRKKSFDIREYYAKNNLNTVRDFVDFDCIA